MKENTSPRIDGAKYFPSSRELTQLVTRFRDLLSVLAIQISPFLQSPPIIVQSSFRCVFFNIERKFFFLDWRNYFIVRSFDVQLVIRVFPRKRDWIDVSYLRHVTSRSKVFFSLLYHYLLCFSSILFLETNEKRTVPYYSSMRKRVIVLRTYSLFTLLWKTEKIRQNIFLKMNTKHDLERKLQSERLKLNDSPE